jgi:hypothetical protein
VGTAFGSLVRHKRTSPLGTHTTDFVPQGHYEYNGFQMSSALYPEATVSFWCYLDGADGTSWGFGPSQAAGVWFYTLSGGSAYFDWGNTGSARSSFVWPTKYNTKWVHLLYSMRASDGKVMAFVNGEKMMETTVTIATPTDTNIIRVGNLYTDTFGFDGAIGGFCLYDKRLTQGDALRLTKAGRQLAVMA